MGSWNSITLATWCEELTHLKTPWCWEKLKARGEGDDRGWDGWIASPTWWTWVWVSSGSCWWTGKPGVVVHGVSELDTTKQLNWTEMGRNLKKNKYMYMHNWITLLYTWNSHNSVHQPKAHIDVGHRCRWLEWGAKKGVLEYEGQWAGCLQTSKGAAGEGERAKCLRAFCEPWAHVQLWSPHPVGGIFPFLERDPFIVQAHCFSVSSFVSSALFFQC